MSATTNSSTTESVSESAHTLVSGSTVSAVNCSFAAVAQQTSASGIPSQPVSIYIRLQLQLSTSTRLKLSNVQPVSLSLAWHRVTVVLIVI